MRCPWLQAETKVATILGILFLLLLSCYLVVTTVIKTPEGWGNPPTPRTMTLLGGQGGIFTILLYPPES